MFPPFQTTNATGIFSDNAALPAPCNSYYFGKTPLPLREGLRVGVAITCRDNGNFPLSLILIRKGGGNSLDVDYKVTRY
jgi:hypothetical protein